MEFKNHKFYNCKITLDNQAEYQVEANWLHNNYLDTWLGWYCEAGKTRLAFDENFNVFSGACKNQYLGNLFESWNKLSEAGVCQKNNCTGCTDDLLVKKWHKQI